MPPERARGPCSAWQSPRGLRVLPVPCPSSLSPERHRDTEGWEQGWKRQLPPQGCSPGRLELPPRMPSVYRRITESFGLKRALKNILFQPPHRALGAVEPCTSCFLFPRVSLSLCLYFRTCSPVSALGAALKHVLGAGGCRDTQQPQPWPLHSVL